MSKPLPANATGCLSGRPYPATGRQQALLRFIHGYLQAKGYAPTFAEMAAGLGYPVTAKRRIAELLDGLEERGHIRRLPNRVRAIEVLHPPAIPRAPDGAPLFVVPLPLQSQWPRNAPPPPTNNGVPCHG